MNSATRVATHFSYGTRINNLHNIFEIKDSPIIKSKVDNNVTRVAAQHYMLGYILSLNKGLRIYQVQNMLSIEDAVTVTDSNWQRFG